MLNLFFKIYLVYTGIGAVCMLFQYHFYWKRHNWEMIKYALYKRNDEHLINAHTWNMKVTLFQSVFIFLYWPITLGRTLLVSPFSSLDLWTRFSMLNATYDDFFRRLALKRYGKIDDFSKMCAMIDYRNAKSNDESSDKTNYKGEIFSEEEYTLLDEYISNFNFWD